MKIEDDIHDILKKYTFKIMCNSVKNEIRDEIFFYFKNEYDYDIEFELGFNYDNNQINLTFLNGIDFVICTRRKKLERLKQLIERKRYYDKYNN